MKKSIISLGIATLLLVTPATIFASTDVVHNQHEQLQNISATNDREYVSISATFSSVSSIPSTYSYSTVIGNKIYRGVLDRRSDAYYYNGYNYEAYYRGYVYFTGDYAY